MVAILIVLIGALWVFSRPVPVSPVNIPTIQPDNNIGVPCPGEDPLCKG